MNRRKEWKNILAIANDDLKQYGYEIKITDYYEDGCYTCEILKDGVSVDVYAENFYEVSGFSTENPQSGKNHSSWSPLLESRKPSA